MSFEDFISDTASEDSIVQAQGLQALPPSTKKPRLIDDIDAGEEETSNGQPMRGLPSLAASGTCSDPEYFRSLNTHPLTGSKKITHAVEVEIGKQNRDSNQPSSCASGSSYGVVEESDINGGAMITCERPSATPLSADPNNDEEGRRRRNISERQRVRRIREDIQILSYMLQQVGKRPGTDRSSILAETINYIKELETKVEPRRQGCILENACYSSQNGRPHERVESMQNGGPLGEHYPQFTASIDFKITNSNKQFQWLSGYSTREVLGSRVNLLCPNIEETLSDMIFSTATCETYRRVSHQKSVMKYHVIVLSLEVTLASKVPTQNQRFVFTVLPPSSAV